MNFAGKFWATPYLGQVVGENVCVALASCRRSRASVVVLVTALIGDEHSTPPIKCPP